MRLRPYVGHLSTLSGLILLLFSCQTWAQTYSRVRMVRLSFVDGMVTVQRPDVQEWATAPVNLPVSEGFKLATGEGGYAEVEFEDTSTARLGQLSQLEFNQLMLSSEGQQVDSLTLQQGYATFHAKGQSVQLFEVRAGNAALVAQGDTLFRLDLQDGQLRLTVLKGAVQVTDPAYSGVIGEKQGLTLLAGEDPPYEISQDTVKDAWDEWVSQRESQSTALESRHNPGVYSNNTTSLLYGMSDLDSFGMWSYFPGYGYGWVPQAGAGWSPYSSGRWCWYPRFGYTWISAEPWGWLPYHYGDWAFDPMMGWFWLPLPAYMGSWSPGRVNWYQGPGWVGWTPQRGTHGHRSNPCPPGGNCATVVSADAFQSGKFLNPRQRMPVDLSQGRQVGQLDVNPGPGLVLPGLPVNWPGGTPARQVPPTLGQPGGRQPSASNVVGAVGVAAPSPAGTALANRPHGNMIPAQRGPSTQGRIVYDPVSGQYLNGPGPLPDAGMKRTLTVQGGTATGAGQLPAQAPPVALKDTIGTKPGQLTPPRAPFQDELGSIRSRPIGSAIPAGAPSKQGNQPSGAAQRSTPTSTWGAPRSPDRSASAPAPPRSTSSPSSSSSAGGGMAPRSSGGGGMGSPGGFGRGGGSMPSSPGGATGTYGGGHGGRPGSGGQPRR